ncbi:MAG: two component transcriptional regulator, winged helix family [Bryobacterales bacterium]|nr:two component transcriptional regulator, winged helix family [Bryobacterales bacterium]
MLSVLVVEDNRDLCAMMREYFAPLGFALETAHDGRAGLARAVEESFDLIILDVMLPVIDGFEVLRQLRRRSAVPVIMLTARTDPADRVGGLNAGADDYLPMPFGPEELLARMHAILRRTQAPVTSLGSGGHTVPQVGSLEVDTAARAVRLRGKAVGLTQTEFDLLECLARGAGRIVTRDAIAAVLYQRIANPYERSIDVRISHLRQKLGRMPQAQKTR